MFLCPLSRVLDLDNVKLGVTLPCNDNLGKKCHSLSSNAACLKLYFFVSSGVGCGFEKV